MPRDFNEFDGIDRNNNNKNRNDENFDRQKFKQGLSGTFSFEELTGDSETRLDTPKRKRNLNKKGTKNVGKSVKFEKPSALINTNKADKRTKKNKSLFGSILSMFHGDSTKERKMTVSSKKTVEEIREQLDKLYDRIKEYEDKLEDKSKEISSKLVELSRQVSRLNKEINKSNRRINMFEKQIKSYETDLDKIKDKDDFMKQTIIDGKIKELNFKIQEEQKKIADAKSRLKPLSEKKEALQEKSKEVKKSIDDLRKRGVAIDQKLGRSSASKESTFEILRRSIKENARRREVEPSQVSNENYAFRTTWNSKTYSFGNPEALKNLGIKGLTLKGLDLARPRENWLEQRLKRAEQNGFSVTPSNERDNKEHGGKDNPDR